jgi:hypothetical protein
MSKIKHLFCVFTARVKHHIRRKRVVSDKDLAIVSIDQPFSKEDSTNDAKDEETICLSLASVNWVKPEHWVVAICCLDKTFLVRLIELETHATVAVPPVLSRVSNNLSTSQLLSLKVDKRLVFHKALRLLGALGQIYVCSCHGESGKVVNSYLKLARLFTCYL